MTTLAPSPSSELSTRLPSPTTTVRLVVCDMAGTTIDEHGLVYDALRDCVLAIGVDVADHDLQAWMGTDKTEAIAALVRLGGGEPTAETVEVAFDDFRDRLDRSYCDHPPVALAGVEELFIALHEHDIKVALTTGFSTDVAAALLAGLGWSVGDQLDAVVCADEVAQGRPAPYLIHRAMERTGIRSTSEVLAVGDTVVDLQAGRNAGVTAVGVLTGKLDRQALESVPHHLVLDGVAALLDHPTVTSRLPM